MANQWRFVLLDTPAPGASISDLNVDGELRDAKNKQIEFILNRPGSLTFSMALTAPLADQIEPLTKTIYAERDGVIFFSGPVWQVAGAAEGNQMTVTAVGWMEELYHRIIRGAYTDDRPVAVPTQEQTFTNIDAGSIARSLILKANAQLDNAGTARPTHVTVAGSYPTSQLRTRTYQKNQNIGQEIQTLSDIEAGFDMDVSPTTRQFTIYYDTVAGTIFGRGSLKPNVLLAYGWGPKNLRSSSFSTEAVKMCNRHIAEGKFSAKIAEDIDSINETGFMFEEVTTLNEVTDPTILAAYAAVEVAVRARPVTVYQINPFPWTLGGAVPRPITDYFLGDIIRMTTKQGAFFVNGVYQRIFGMTISVGDNGEEAVSSLQVAPS